MSIGILTGSTLTKFMENKDVFEKCVNEYFKLLVDASGGEGGLSHDVFREGFCGFFVPESQPQSKEEVEQACDSVFERFGKDRKGNMDRGEFGSLLREIMVAMAEGLGNTVVLVYLDRDGLLSRAIKHELVGGK